MDNNTLIQASQLIASTTAFTYEGNALDIRIEPGEVVAIIGPDYAGKSDWLRCLAGVQAPAAGHLALLGRDVQQFSRNDWVQARRQLAYVKSDNAILSAANALQNVVLPARYHRIADGRTLTSRATRLLAELGLFDLISLPALLRKDQRFRIAIARALILQPAALLLDNPFAMLDNIAAETLKQYLLRRVREQHMSLVILTHDTRFALEHARQIVFITPDEVLRFDRQNRIEQCKHQLVQNFLNPNDAPC